MFSLQCKKFLNIKWMSQTHHYTIACNTIEFKMWIMVFNSTYSNISVISWLSVLLVEETGVPRENHWPASNCWPTWSHNVVSLDYEVFYCYVYSNKIHELSEDPLSLGELKVLEMSCNDIKSVPETFFQGCSKLDTLDLENNKLGNIKYTCIARVK